MPPRTPTAPNAMTARKKFDSPLISPSGSRRIVRPSGGAAAAGGGQGKVDFMARQRERASAKAARLESRRKEIHDAEMNRPAYRPVTTGHDVMGRPIHSSSSERRSSSLGSAASPKRRPQTQQSTGARSSSGTRGRGSRGAHGVGDALSVLRLYVQYDITQRCQKALTDFCKAIPDGERSSYVAAAVPASALLRS
jgi:hypothetical protein